MTVIEKLDMNVKQANSDFVAIKNAIVESGVEVAEGTRTADYADKVKEVYQLGCSKGTETREPTEIDLSSYESNGEIVETYADGSTKTTIVEFDESNGTIVETFADGSTRTTTVEFDEIGNPIKITDGNGNETVITW